MQTKTFINLTNGIELIPNIDLSEINFIRIQSTMLERKNWEKLFLELDNNFLMWAAIGNVCNVYDFGTRREISKTIYMGIPIIKYCLNKFWYDYEEDFVCLDKSGNNHKNFIENEIYQPYFIYPINKTIDAKIKINEKYRYFRKWLNKNNTCVNIFGYSKSTKYDSDVEYYRLIIDCHLSKINTD